MLGRPQSDGLRLRVDGARRSTAVRRQPRRRRGAGSGERGGPGQRRTAQAGRAAGGARGAPGGGRRGSARWGPGGVSTPARAPLLVRALLPSFRSYVRMTVRDNFGPRFPVVPVPNAANSLPLI